MDVGAPKYLIDLAERVTRLTERLAELELVKARSTRQPLRSRERRILAAVGTGSLQAKQIARAIGVELNNGLYGVLADMVRWGLLTKNGEGYVVAPEWVGVAEVEEGEPGDN